MKRPSPSPGALTRAAFMIDLHCHLLPGIDAGAVDREMSLGMARIAVQGGIRTIACTPHIYPGRYDNDAHGIRAAIAKPQAVFDQGGIRLRLAEGADVHWDTDLHQAVRDGRIPTLAAGALRGALESMRSTGASAS